MMFRGLLLAAAILWPGLALATEPPAPSIDPRIAGPAIEAMQATIRLRDAQLTVMAERLKQLEGELQAKVAPAPAPPKPAE